MDKIVKSFNNFFEENETYSKKELLEFAKKTYDENSKELKKKSSKKNDEEKEKKPLNAYQLFMKEQRAILNKRESEKGEGEEKLNSKDLMREIASMWNERKTALPPIVKKPKEMFVEEVPETKKVLPPINNDADDEAVVIDTKPPKKTIAVKKSSSKKSSKSDNDTGSDNGSDTEKGNKKWNKL
jgi:hypothetical protein